MSASIDKEDSTDGEGGAREVLASWLETHAAGGCDTPTMQSRFLDVCRRHPDAPWDALALLDQYQRRGKLEPDVAQVLKREIAQMVFGTPAEATPQGREERRAPLSSQQWQSKPSASPRSSSMEDEEDDELEEEDEEDEAPARMQRPRIVRTPEPSHVAFRAEIAPETRAAAREPVRTLRGRYELQELLGRGSDGVVYRALDRNREQLAESQRFVAIKLLHTEPELSGPALVEYQRRAHQAQQLVHPHIGRVLDFDHDGKQRFLVMEYVSGQPLSALLERGAIAHQQAKRVIANIGEALAYVHGNGVVLGNLTPRKVLIAASGEAKLIDIGFAPSAAELGQAATPEHAYAARYASAERISGEPLSSADDVYSFACIAYELLTRRHPYEGRSGAAARVHQLRPEPIAALSAAAWVALERGLRASRTERDITVMQLVAVLSEPDVGSLAQPEVAIRAPRREPASQPRSRAAAWLFAVMLIVLAGIAAWWWLPASDRAEVRKQIGTIEAPLDDVLAPKSGPPAPPTDSARTLSGGQVIPAQPAGTATGPSAFEAANEAPETQTESTASAEPTSAAPSAPPAAGATQAGIIGFPKDTYVVRESDVVVRIPVVRSRGTRGEVSFRWRIERNSAEPGSDFGAVGPSQEFMASGQSSTVLHIPLVSDSVREGTEMFMVHIDEAGGGARLGELTRAAVIIVDDD